MTPVALAMSTLVREHRLGRLSANGGKSGHKLVARQAKQRMSLDKQIDVDGIKVLAVWVSEPADVPRCNHVSDPVRIRASLLGRPGVTFAACNAAQPTEAVVGQWF